MCCGKGRDVLAVLYEPQGVAAPVTEQQVVDTGRWIDRPQERQGHLRWVQRGHVEERALAGLVDLVDHGQGHRGSLGRLLLERGEDFGWDVLQAKVLEVGDADALGHVRGRAEEDPKGASGDAIGQEDQLRDGSGAAEYGRVPVILDRQVERVQSQSRRGPLDPCQTKNIERASKTKFSTGIDSPKQDWVDGDVPGNPVDNRANQALGKDG